MFSTTMPSVVRILLVEDNPGDTTIIQEAFREIESATEVTAMNDSERAMAHLLERNDSHLFYDFILLDLNLAKMSGHEFLQQLKSQPVLRSIPVLVLTSSRSDQDVTKAYENYCNGFFCKPNTFTELVEMMDCILKYWRLAIRINSRATRNLRMGV
jgi:two-component system, chemotaxis family, response regulator Rcp1